jgi:WD40 repeat protein
VQGGVTILPPLPRASEPTAIEKVGRYFDCDAVPTGAVAVGDSVYASFGDGQVRVFRPDLPMQEMPAHNGAILCMARHGSGVLTGGDDGRVLYLDADKGTVELARHGGKWVDCVASHSKGAWAASVGKTAHLTDIGGRVHALDHPSTVGGMAFDRNCERLAVAHYGGVTLWTRGRRDWKASSLKWAGSHGAVTWSPDNRFLVTTMQENALHGWRLRDKADMRMSGYPAKVKSMDWVGKLPHLASSGAQEAICWPFDGANGPMGQRPLTLCHDGDALATAVCGLPGHDAVLTGFENGVVLYSELDMGFDPRVIKRRSGAAITHLVVTPDTGWMLAAAEDGLVLWAPLGRTDR